MSAGGRAGSDASNWRAWGPGWWAVAAFLLIGSAFTAVDVLLPISTYAPAVWLALGLGFLVALPLFFGGRTGLRQMMISLAVFATFAAWITTLRLVEWDASKPFYRAYFRIRSGMTIAEVDAVMRAEFRGRKLPRSGWNDSGGGYLLDEDDGRFNAEIISIHMSDGRVVSAEYLPD